VLTLREYYVTIYAPLRLRSRAKRTKQLYETTLRTFAKYLGRQPMLRDLNNDEVNKYLAWFRDLGRSPYSTNKEHANLTAIWRYACRRKLLDEWPDVEREKQPRKAPMAWLEHELQAIFSACDKEPGLLCGVPAGMWWRGLLLTLYDTGERISAISGLKWSALDIKGGWLVVPAELRKGGKSDRVYKLAPDTIETLSRIKMHSRFAAIFKWPFTPSYLWSKYSRILARAGLPTDCRSKFHRIRRTTASYYERAGGNATKLLDHSDRRVTDRHYIDERIVQQKAACDVLWRPGPPSALTGCFMLIAQLAEWMPW
jgi:integrase